jgi:dihydropyrimidinase
VAIGSDADLVIFDPKKSFKLTAETNHHNVDYTPYEGYEGKGVPRIVISQGKVLVRDGKFLGKPGQGRYIKRKTFKIL